MVKGMTLDQAAAIKNSELAEELALPPVKIHCSIWQRMLSKQQSQTTDPNMITLTEVAANKVKNN